MTDRARGHISHGVSRSVRRPAGHGLTHVEVICALSIAAVILLGTLSAITVATRAMPNGQNTATAVLDTAAALEVLTADLHYATLFTLPTTRAVEFLVADRNDADALPETIRYAWSGEPGDPLVRTYNGTAAVILNDVQDFVLQYETGIVRCTLRAGDDPSRLTTAVRILNEPEVAGP